MGLVSLKNRYWSIGCLLVIVSLAACRSSTPPDQAAPAPSELEPRLVLNNAALEQATSSGETQWKIVAERVEYSQDRQIVYIEKITANIYQEGEIALKVSGNRGRILQEEETFFLEGEVIATDPRNGAVIRAEEVEWNPKGNVLTVRQDLRGNYQDLTVSAEEGRYYSQTQRLELVGEVVATTRSSLSSLEAGNQDPLDVDTSPATDEWVSLTTEQLVWDLPLEQVSSEAKVQLVRYQNQAVTDRVVADRTKVDLANQTAHLQQNVELKSLEPPVDIATNSVIWRYQERQFIADQPIQVVHRQEQIDVTGNQGQVNLEQETARLSGGVRGTSDRSQAKLYSQELTWTISSQTVEAVGSVVYEQTNPPAKLTGTRAVGNLQNNRIAVTGAGKERVVTRIVP